MLNVFGKATTTASGTKYSHLFEVNETNQHQSLTIGLADDTQDKQFPLAMVDSLELNATTWDFVKATASFKSQKGIDATLTPSYSEDIALLWKNVKVYLADDLAGLASATALSASSVSLTINKNLEDVDVLWSVIPQDFCNTQFWVEGTLELLWDDATYHQLFITIYDWTKWQIKKSIKNWNWRWNKRSFINNRSCKCNNDRICKNAR